MIAHFETLCGERFPLGRLLATPGALEAIPGADMLHALKRHSSGDWGELCDADKAENEYAVGEPLRILSAYRSADGVTFWIITEADRSVTTVLLPDEY